MMYSIMSLLSAVLSLTPVNVVPSVSTSSLRSSACSRAKASRSPGKEKRRCKSVKGGRTENVEEMRLARTLEIGIKQAGNDNGGIGVVGLALLPPLPSSPLGPSLVNVKQCVRIKTSVPPPQLLLLPLARKHSRKAIALCRVASSFCFRLCCCCCCCCCC